MVHYTLHANKIYNNNNNIFYTDKLYNNEIFGNYSVNINCDCVFI